MTGALFKGSTTESLNALVVWRIYIHGDRWKLRANKAANVQALLFSVVVFVRGLVSRTKSWAGLVSPASLPLSTTDCVGVTLVRLICDQFALIYNRCRRWRAMHSASSRPWPWKAVALLPRTKRFIPTGEKLIGRLVNVARPSFNSARTLSWRFGCLPREIRPDGASCLGHVASVGERTTNAWNDSVSLNTVRILFQHQCKY